MSKIRIKHFGPIKEGYLENNGWIDIQKVTTFIGNQGSGKSVVAKLISTFTWIEKALTRGDYDIKWFTRKNKLRNQYLTYHRLENYFPRSSGEENTIIEYLGDSYHLFYDKGNLIINPVINLDRSQTYPLPQIMYVPAERNFISNVKTPRALKLTSDSLIEFVTEFDNAKSEIKGSIKLPINDVDVEYDKQHDLISIKGNNYKVRLTEASSGFQSLVPLYLVSWFLASSVKQQSEVDTPMSSEELQRYRKAVADIWSNDNLTDDQKRINISILSSKFNKKAFINIVEEPEQNLFPTSQWQMLKSLLEFNNMNPGNKLIMTTHSPYIVNYLSVAVQGGGLLNKIKASNKSQDLIPKFKSIISTDAVIAAAIDNVIYQLNEKDGTIKRLPNFEGIPSDKNYLNQTLAEGNRLFDSLLEIEESL